MEKESTITVTGKATFAHYGKSFQEKILQALLTDHAWAQQMLEVVDESYFDLKYLRFLADRYFKYAKKYKVFPTLQLLVTIIKEDLKTGPDAVLRDQIIEYLTRMRANPDAGDLQYVKDKSLDFCKKQALKSALETAVDMMTAEKYESIVEEIKKAVSVGTASSIGHDFMSDIEARFVKISRNAVPTGLEELDKKGLLNGGLGKGELGVIVAATGVGKCVQRDTYVHVKYVSVKIDGKHYKPWDRVPTKRGLIFARDVVETDELV